MMKDRGCKREMIKEREIERGKRVKDKKERQQEGWRKKRREGRACQLLNCHEYLMVSRSALCSCCLREMVYSRGRCESGVNKMALCALWPCSVQPLHYSFQCCAYFMSWQTQWCCGQEQDNALSVLFSSLFATVIFTLCIGSPMSYFPCLLLLRERPV